ncbi:hypothetical protein DFH09DRAFT_1099705 [Mycena vulgaris]|nr:hypothetical protein DFH09DRAFT_1099705 [Mycena vulgaris]
MPRHTSATETRLNNVIIGLTPAIELLRELHDAFSTPFVPIIATTALKLIEVVQEVKMNKNQCLLLMENIHVILYAIIQLHLKSESGGTLPPTTLKHVGKFTETLYKILTFVEAQQDANRIKLFFRYTATLFKDCRAGLEQALDVFKIFQPSRMRTQSTLYAALGYWAEKSTYLQKQMYQSANSSWHSSDSFAMLPSRPKIFHGRDSELEEVVNLFRQGSPRIAILGTGGMGKTSLARAALHHPEIGAKHNYCLFVACDSATTSVELAGLIGSHLGLKPGKDLTKPVFRHFAIHTPCLLILDNLETSWEPTDSRARVEEFLSLLTDLVHLSLIVGITMRGAERPAKVRWTRPLLKPLHPLSDTAAHQTFIDIADDFHDPKDITRLLNLTDNLPLAVDMIAHLVDYEGCAQVLTRWPAERTAVLSDGHDKRSNLDASIAISLSSPRLSSVPGAKELLGLLSVLPDGLSDSELVQIKLPISQVMACKTALLRTALAYSDDNKRLKALVPIREYMQHQYPPAPRLVQSVRKHFHSLLDLYREYRGVETAQIVPRITLNLGNIHQMLLYELHADDLDLPDLIYCTMAFNVFNRITGRGRTTLMDHIPTILPGPTDPRLEADLITQTFFSKNHVPIDDPEELISKAVSHFRNLSDPSLESRFYNAVGSYYCCNNEIAPALQAFQKSRELSRLAGDRKRECTVMNSIAGMEQQIGHYPAGRLHAIEAQYLAKLAGDIYLEAAALQTEALCNLSLGNLEDIIRLCRRAKHLLELCGISGGSLYHQTLNKEAGYYLMKSEYAEAREIHVHIAQEISSGNFNSFNQVFAVLSITDIDIITGVSHQDVKRNLLEAERLCATVESPTALLFHKAISADLQLREGQYAAAKTEFTDCVNSSRGRNSEVMAYCLERLADTGRWGVNDSHSAYQWTTVYLAYAVRAKERRAIYIPLQFLGDVFLSHGDEETAHHLFITALAGFTQMDVHRNRADCMLRLGDIAQQRGDIEEATELWHAARALYERSLRTNDITQLDRRLASIADTDGGRVGDPGTGRS